MQTKVGVAIIGNITFPVLFFVYKYLLVPPSGGLLICLPRDKAQSYCDELQSVDGQPAWIVGEVVHGNRLAKMQTDLKIIEV